MGAFRAAFLPRIGSCRAFLSDKQLASGESGYPWQLKKAMQIEKACKGEIDESNSTECIPFLNGVKLNTSLPD